MRAIIRTKHTTWRNKMINRKLQTLHDDRFLQQPKPILRLENVWAVHSVKVTITAARVDLDSQVQNQKDLAASLHEEALRAGRRHRVWSNDLTHDLSLVSKVNADAWRTKSWWLRTLSSSTDSKMQKPHSMWPNGTSKKETDKSWWIIWSSTLRHRSLSTSSYVSLLWVKEQREDSNLWIQEVPHGVTIQEANYHQWLRTHVAKHRGVEASDPSFLPEVCSDWILSKTDLVLCILPFIQTNPIHVSQEPPLALMEVVVGVEGELTWETQLRECMQLSSPLPMHTGLMVPTRTHLHKTIALSSQLRALTSCLKITQQIRLQSTSGLRNRALTGSTKQINRERTKDRGIEANSCLYCQMPWLFRLHTTTWLWIAVSREQLNASQRVDLVVSIPGARPKPRWHNNYLSMRQGAHAVRKLDLQSTLSSSQSHSM